MPNTSVAEHKYTLLVYRSASNVLCMRVTALSFLSAEYDALDYCPELEKIADHVTGNNPKTILVDGKREDNETVIIPAGRATIVYKESQDAVYIPIRIPTTQCFKATSAAEAVGFFASILNVLAKAADSDTRPRAEVENPQTTTSTAFIRTTEDRWIVAEPGKLILEGTEFMITHQPWLPNPFVIHHHGQPFVFSLSTLAIAKAVLAEYRNDLKEMGVDENKKPDDGL